MEVYEKLLKSLPKEELMDVAMKLMDIVINSDSDERLSEIFDVQIRLKNKSQNKTKQPIEKQETDRKQPVNQKEPEPEEPEEQDDNDEVQEMIDDVFNEDSDEDSDEAMDVPKTYKGNKRGRKPKASTGGKIYMDFNDVEI